MITNLNKKQQGGNCIAINCFASSVTIKIIRFFAKVNLPIHFLKRCRHFYAYPQ